MTDIVVDGDAGSDGEGFVVAFTNTASNRVRYRFEPRSVGGWDRIEEHFDTGVWRRVGAEIVCDLELTVRTR